MPGKNLPNLISIQKKVTSLSLRPKQIARRAAIRCMTTGEKSQIRYSCGAGWAAYFLAALIAGSVPATPVMAALQSFKANLEAATWEAESSEQGCRLYHRVPHFGEVRFVYESVGGRRLKLLPDFAPDQSQIALLQSVAPPWRHRALLRPLGEQMIHGAVTAMDLAQSEAMRIYFELQQGMQPELYFSDWGDGQDHVAVSVSPVRFRAAADLFETCAMRVAAESSARRVAEQPLIIHFSTDSDELTQEASDVLLAFSTKVLKQEGASGLIMEAHADERGTDAYNTALSIRRGAAVRDYLIQCGVPAERLTVNALGESDPVDRATNTQAWRKNRRVQVVYGG